MSHVVGLSFSVRWRCLILSMAFSMKMVNGYGNLSKIGGLSEKLIVDLVILLCFKLEMPLFDRMSKESIMTS